MEQARISDRRTGRYRRVGGASSYTGPERRSLKYRRNGVDRKTGSTAVCIYCGEVYSASTIKTTVGCRTGICIDCSSTRFPQFYTN